MTVTDFILYGTEGCHLCEEAVLLLQVAGIEFTEQDIIDDEQAMQQYAVRIPVLFHQASGAELGWPFCTDQLQRFIAQS
jgi:glutaredoxin